MIYVAHIHVIICQNLA